jgi:hypothetical protein
MTRNRVSNPAHPGSGTEEDLHASILPRGLTWSIKLEKVLMISSRTMVPSSASPVPAKARVAAATNTQVGHRPLGAEGLAR